MRIAIPLVNYWVNYESYLERCENKAKPELDCDGCCQVKKEVAEVSQEEKNHQNQRTQTTETIELFHFAADILAFAAPQTGVTSFLVSFEPSPLPGVGTLPFQPPRR